MDNKFETTDIVKIRLTASDIWLLGWIYLELCLHHLVFDLGFFSSANECYHKHEYLTH
jgi:hypothetical protein